VQRDLQRQDRARILRALATRTPIVVHLEYGYGVAGKRALEQVELLRFHLGRIGRAGQQVVVNIRPWLEANHFTDEIVEDMEETDTEETDMDTELTSFLEAWMSTNKHVSYYPTIRDVRDQIDASDPQDSRTTWSEFGARFNHRSTNVLPC